MSRSHSKKRKRSIPPETTDLEEISPRQFLVRNPQVRPFLKGEGHFDGNRFELTTWRREGLLARLRAHTFTVHTLDDRIAELPPLPPTMPVGAPCSRPVSSSERYSFFDPQTLTWTAIETQKEHGQPEVLLHAGWIIRRRRGRGPASYYRVTCERSGGAGILPLSETEALLAGYAHATAVDQPALPVNRTAQYYHLPTIPLPPPHHQLMQRLGQQTEQGRQIDEQGWPLAREVYARLGLTLEEPET
jgi:hypothetical protein